ncbi:MAG: hypothetical protein JNL83_26415 [Myxococcales bacterium]|nr:hypothetical protein [Myxococcales bacterium]
MGETFCPLCETPRPRGAKRCVCNYTFEYDRPMHAVLRRGGAAPRLDGLLLAVALVAGAVAFYLARNVAQPPRDSMLPTILLAIGTFTLFGAFAAPRWFMGNRRARLVVWLVGSSGARVFYAALGGAFAGGAAGFVLHP